MKIAQFIASSGWGGAEKIFLDLCNELVKTHELTAITYDNPIIIQHLDPRIKTIILPKTGRKNPRTYWRLYHALKSETFDVIHTHCAKASGIIYYLSRLLPMHQVATKHNPRRGLIFDKVRHVTAVSSSVASTVKHGAMVICNGIAAVACQLTDTRHTPFKMVAIGRLDPIKGFDLLIKQVARLKFDFNLEIIGEGAHRSELQTQINRLQLHDKITLSGYRTDVSHPMSQADLAIISSHSEGFSLVAVEALFYAKVLLSTRVGIANDLLDDHLLTDHAHLAEKITQIASDYTWHRNHFRTIQKQNRGRFMIENTAKSYVDFYAQTFLD